MAGREKPSNRKVFRDANKIINPPGYLIPSFTKHERLLQDLVKAGLEQGEPLQTKPDKDEGAGHGRTRMRGALKYLRTGSLLDERTLPGTKPF